jgi:hypothetical protein
VCDPTRQMADRVHLLRLEKGFLGLSPLGQVARDLGESQQRTRRTSDGIDDDMRPEALAILANPPPLGLELAGARGSPERGRRNAALDVLFGIESREVPADDFAGGVALEALGAGIPARDIAGSVEHVDRIVGNGIDK